jgi:hypothetical protein
MFEGDKNLVEGSRANVFDVHGHVQIRKDESMEKGIGEKK